MDKALYRIWNMELKQRAVCICDKPSRRPGRLRRNGTIFIIKFEHLCNRGRLWRNLGTSPTD